VLEHVGGYDSEADRQHERRPLTADELAELFEATREAPASRRLLDGPQRAMLYLAACGTGFRANELRSLAIASLRRDDDPPCIVPRAASAKSRQPTMQPIRRDLADALAAFVKGRAREEPLFPRMTRRTAEMLLGDFRRAGDSRCDGDSS
jgi:integrase